MSQIPFLATLVIWIVFLLFSGVIHEYCHALAAHRQGDPTPSQQGRVTLNPIPHIDPIWTIAMPAVLLLASNGAFAFGGARPVAMNPAHFRDPEKGFTIAAAVGPLSNFALALIPLGIALVYLPDEPLVHYALSVFYFVNILLGVFNLIPIPPLDGSRILRFVLPTRWKRFMDQMEQYGIMIIFGIIIMLNVLNIHIFGYIIGVFMIPAHAVGLGIL